MLNLQKLKTDFRNSVICKADYIKKMHSLHLSLFEYSEFIKKTDIGKIEISDYGVSMTLKNSELKFLFVKEDLRSQPLEVLNFDYYEKPEIEMILKILPKKTVMFDIGAHTGWYALQIKRFIKDATVYAFEPVPLNYSYLTKNIVLNNFKNKIQTFNFGLSEKESKTIFYINKSMLGNASSTNLKPGKNVQKIICRLRKLDNFIKEKKILKIDFIKCDVEGAEFSVFKGAYNSLLKYKPIIFTELLRKWAKKFNYHPNDLILFLNKLGYGCFEIKKSNLSELLTMDENTISTNFFFLHKVKHKKIIHSFTQ